ncbi:MAG: cobalamin-dependent protein [Armatimonadota bacterium]|nr:cobalamin-dependent protein [Armatimonadota bacterium]MDW8155702.1 cobalamin-dependent protein [Armatimonadota bacterium]
MRTIPKYTIRQAARLVGLQPATLRAWERRYGFPRPARTASRYRLFSDADLEWIRWVRDRIAEGIPARQAVWLAARRRATGVPALSGATPAPEVLREELLTNLLAFDEPRAAATLWRATVALGSEGAVRHVLLPAVATLGEQWEAGRATVSQEHFASQFAARHLATLLLGTPPAGPRAVLACAPGERHELGLMYLAVALRQRGWTVLYLGADTPAESLLDTVQRVRPRAVVVAGLVVDLAALWEPYRPRCLAAVRRGVLWVWGGPAAAAPEASRLPGRLAPTLEEALRILEDATRARVRAG